MISSTLGAPLGGTTVGGQYGLESAAVSLITPPNFGSGGGSCFPLIVVVALGEPGVPVIRCACAGRATKIATAAVSRDKPERRRFIVFIGLFVIGLIRRTGAFNFDLIGYRLFYLSCVPGTAPGLGLAVGKSSVKLKRRPQS